MPTNRIKAAPEVDASALDPKNAAAIEASVKGPDQAPTVSDQSGSFTDWKKIRDQLGEPFDALRVPLRKLMQMRRDPMLSFGMHYQKVPLVNVQWHMEAQDKNGPNAQVAAFMDQVWRAVHADYIFCHTLDLDFGFQAIVKRFELRNPGGVYVDANGNTQPVWDQGTINPMILKPFVALPPDKVQPSFDVNTGEFTGILLEVATSDRKKASGFKSRPAGGAAGGSGQNQQQIDVWHSLWATNDRQSVFGSVYGFPRLAHAYRYWWSYWWRWAQYDRAFERMAIPPIVAFHPEGDWEDPNDSTLTMPYQEIALEMAERLRSNAIAAVPSTLATSGLDEKGTQVRQWDFKFLETPNNPFEHFDQAFGYLDVMKLRSVWVPEQAFIEGEGGTSSRNVAGQMAEVFDASQQNKWEEIAKHINEYIIPQLLIINFPDFVNNGGTCRIVGHGFEQQDLELQRQIVQLLGQSDPLLLGADVRQMMRNLNVPVLSPQEQAQQQAEAAARSQASSPPPTKPTNGKVGVIPATPQGQGGSRNGGSVPEPAAPGSVTGFADDRTTVYIQPGEVIELSSDADFLASLPATKHYSDKAIKALAARLRKQWQSHYHSLYSDFASFLEEQESLELDDEPDLIFAIGDRVPLNKAKKLAKKLLADWDTGDRFSTIADRSRKVLTSMLSRAIKLERKDVGIKDEVSADDIDQFIEQQTGRLLKSTTDTVRKEISDHLVASLRQGKTQAEIATELRQTFDGFPDWKADRVARSETRDVVNASTLLAGTAGGIKYVRASDGVAFDEQCRERNGKLFTIREAWKEMSPSKTHPNDTLGFTLVPRADFDVQPLNDDNWPAERDRFLAFYDDEEGKVYYKMSLHGDDDAWRVGIEPFASKIAQGLIVRNKMDDMGVEAFA